jgi:hypothetical protein
VCNSFGSWLRTIRPVVAPSDSSSRPRSAKTLPEFLLNCPEKGKRPLKAVLRRDLTFTMMD